MNYVESFNLYGIDAKEIPCIKGSGAPTNVTAPVGCLYMNTGNGNLYKCTAVSNGVCAWERIADENYVNTAIQTYIDEAILGGAW